MHDINKIIIEGVSNDIPLADIYANINIATAIAADVTVAVDYTVAADFAVAAVDKKAFYGAALSLIEAGAIPSNYMVCWCGADCSRCRTFRATIGGDDEMRELVRGYYNEIGYNVESEDINCFGCRSDEMMRACADCPYMKCGKGKGLDRCDECGEYPCESLQWYIEKYIKPGIGKFFIE